ncbi:N-6 DNA methylase [candidate division KSB1 bacterium]|nr:N-6 DNA methylase [candidate division KSB1 bacterium]
MKLYEAKVLIKDVFEHTFDRDRYTQLIINLLKDIEEKSFTYQGNFIPNAFKNYIRKMERIGKFADEEGNSIDILIVELLREHSIEYARSAQRNFVRWYLSGSRGGQMKDAALVAFHSKKSSEWRFSLIKMQYSLEKKKDEFTPAKRFSFLVGEKGKSHTAQRQLVNLLKSDDIPLLSDLEEAFNIESVTNEFFEKYKALVFNLVEELERILDRDTTVRKEFESKNIAVIDFAKKLMGQIVFLYFLQRKGWLGLKNGERYGSGDRHFLRSLYNMKKRGENFFNDYLEYLFYEALSKKRVTDAYARFNCRIPFLNGGLFDPINFYDWGKIDILIPDRLFTNINKTREGDTGDGILDIFDLYNFTVNEAEPLDKEVAVDPEMLGKVFERMLDVKERKSKGAFYTPREIVHYMSQESLIHYLDSALNDSAKPYQPVGEDQTSMFSNEVKKGQGDLLIEHGRKILVPKEDIEILIKHGEQLIDKDAAILEERLKESANKYQIPESIRKNAKLIDDKLRDIRVCDPAVGSGAFPVGVMTEIVKARQILTPFIDGMGAGAKYLSPLRTTYTFKSHCIHHNLYGVDIDPSAVEICKLRLWLSLVVDEQRIDEIEPLPNLDYKIVRGNSLINMPDDVMRDQQLEKEIEQLMEKYYAETDKQAKRGLKDKIDGKIKQLLKSAEQFTSYPIDFDFKLFFHEVFKEKGGFDVIIGNPPYGAKIKGKYRQAAVSFIGKVPDYEIYYFFIDLSTKLLKDKGNLSYIIPNTFLFNVFAEKYRIDLLKHWQINEILDCTDFQIFEATVRNAIINFVKTNKSNKKIGYRYSAEKYSFEELVSSKKKYISEKCILQSNKNWALAFRLLQNKLNIILAIKSENTLLNEYFPEVTQGLIAYDKYRGQSKEIIENRKFHYIEKVKST